MVCWGRNIFKWQQPRDRWTKYYLICKNDGRFFPSDHQKLKTGLGKVLCTWCNGKWRNIIATWLARIDENPDTKFFFLHTCNTESTFPTFRLKLRLKSIGIFLFCDAKTAIWTFHVWHFSRHQKKRKKSFAILLKPMFYSSFSWKAL